jgi:Protein of unknown function (DUF3396)
MNEVSRPTAKTFQDMELELEGVRQVSAVFSINFYTSKTLTSFADGVIACYQRFLDICPANRLTFYGTETMSRHRPVTKRALNMLSTWLKPDAPPREFIAIELKSGEDYREAPIFRFQVLGGEPGSVAFAKKWANLISLAFPPEQALEQPEFMLDLVEDLCGFIPFSSGHAGFSLECSPYAQEKTETHAWKTSMRYPGLDIYMNGRRDTIAAGHDGLKTVGWLTVLSNELAEGVGGRNVIAKKLSEECELIDIAGGLVARAGPRPAVGDRNRSDYLLNCQSVYEAFRPLLERAAKRAPYLKLAGDQAEGTQQWYKRFADGR